MHRCFRWASILCMAIWIGFFRHSVSKLQRSLTKGSSYITSYYTNILDDYQFYNRTEQNRNSYFEFKYTAYKNQTCGNLKILPMKRPCTPYLHIHPHQIEKFTLVQGQLSYQMNDKIYSCDIATCPSPIVILPNVPHTFWMSDNKEDLILTIRIEPTFEDHGLRASSFENLIGVRRDKLMDIWQALVFIDSFESYPIALPLTVSKIIFRMGAHIGQLLGYKVEYDEYTTKY